MKAYIMYDGDVDSYELVTEIPEDCLWMPDVIEVDLSAGLIKKHLIAQEKWAGMQKSLETVYLERTSNANGIV